jgi:hypothetical protein
MQDKTVDLGKEAWDQSCEQTNGNQDPWKRADAEEVMYLGERKGRRMKTKMNKTTRGYW